MNTENYDKQRLEDYLLSALPDAETERFDEMSFTDEAFADALTAAENDLVDDYVSGRLDGARLEKFNAHYLASPRRREKVEFAAAFQNYAGRPKNAEVKSAGFFTAFADFFSANRLKLGFAALALMTILSSLWFFASRQERPETASVTPDTAAPENKQSAPAAVAETPAATVSPTNRTSENLNKNAAVAPNRNTTPEKTPAPRKITVASFILAPPVRSASVPTVTIPKNTSFAAFRLELEADEYDAYQVSLEDRNGQNLWQIPSVKAQKQGANNFLNLRFKADLLNADVYTLTVKARKADGTTEFFSSYPFRVVLK